MKNTIKIVLLLTLIMLVLLGIPVVSNAASTETATDEESLITAIQNVDDGSKHKTKIVVTTPKSQNSVRIIPLPDSLINILSRFKLSPRAYILTGCDDKFMEPRVLQYKFKKYAIESGVRNINYHALRHTFATRCIELGFDVKTLSEILGHANVNVTLNRYVHSSMELKRTSMQLFRF